jgi:hypothetical protein
MGIQAEEGDDSGHGYWYRRHSLRLAQRRQFATRATAVRCRSGYDFEKVDATRAKLIKSGFKCDTVPSLTF